MHKPDNPSPAFTGRKSGRVYLTHCTGIKNEQLKNLPHKVTPEQLYASTPIRRFMSRCKRLGVKWAIFSDRYGVWFPEEKHPWYDKHPGTVTEKEFRELLTGFDRSLADFSEIWFYNNPSWFHPLYRRIIDASGLNPGIRTFSHLSEIGSSADVFF